LQRGKRTCFCYQKRGEKKIGIDVKEGEIAMKNVISNSRGVMAVLNFLSFEEL
jgi:hypothetical protein